MSVNTVTILALGVGVVIQLLFGFCLFPVNRGVWAVILLAIGYGSGCVAAAWGLLGRERYPWQFIALLWMLGAYVCVEHIFHFSWVFRVWILPFVFQASITGVALLFIRNPRHKLFRAATTTSINLATRLVSGYSQEDDGVLQARAFPPSLWIASLVVLPVIANIALLWVVLPVNSLLVYLEWPLPKQMLIFAGLTVAVVRLGIVLRANARTLNIPSAAVVFAVTEILALLGERREDELVFWSIVAGIIVVWLLAYARLLDICRYRYGPPRSVYQE